MTDPIPEWLRQTPNLESLHNLPDVPWGGWNPREVPLPSLPELADIVQFFLDNFLGWVAKALGAIEILGWKPFEWLVEFGQQLQDRFSNLAALFGLTDVDLDGDIDVNDVWQAVVSTFIQPIIDIVGQIGDALNSVLAPIFGGIDFNDLPTPAEVWQTVINTLMLPLNLLLGPNSPLNALNIFGRLQLPQFGGGVPLSALTPTVPNELEPFSATSVPTSDGWSWDAAAGAAKVVADGSTKTLFLSGAAIKVDADQPLQYQIPVRYTGVTSGAGQTIQLALDTFTSDDGSGTATRVVVGSITSPSGTLSVPTVLGALNWDVPDGVGSVRPVLVVDELVTAGSVFWLNTPVLKKKLAGPLSGGLPKAIQDRIDDMQATWDKFKGGVGGTVDDIEDALDGAGQAIRDAIANALGHSGTGHTSANILTYLQNIPQTVVSGLTTDLGNLQTTLNQIGDIFNNAVVTPINSVVQSVKDWWDQWFGGGSSNAIPLSQKGAANGVAPLDSSSLIPAQYIPGGVGGGGEPTDHILFTLAGNQSIPSGSATALTGWQQVGSVTATFDDGTNTRWTFPKAGWWDIQSQVVWDTSTTGKRQSAIVRALSSGSVIPATDGADAADCPAWPVRNKIRDTQEVGVRSPLAATDKFSIEAYQNSGAALSAVAGYPDGTYVLATYLGQRQADAVTVMPVAFDARGGGGSVAASGSATTTWSHTATGLDRFVIVFAAFKPSSVTGLNCTASYGGVGMTRVAFLTSSSNAVLAAFIMEDPPTGAKTVSVTASNSSGSVYLIADSLSYTGVGGYTVSNTTLTSSTAMSQSVSSAANRMVAQAFAADGSNGLSAYSQTQRLTASYSSFVRMVAGDAAGAGTVNFTGTSSGGSSKYWGTAIDLQQVSV